MNMKRLLVSAVLISIFFANDASPGEIVTLDRFLNMVKSGNGMIISEAKSLEAARFSALASVSDQRLSFGAAVSGNYLTGYEQGGSRDADRSGFEVMLGFTQPIGISGKFGLRERQEILSYELRRVGLENTVNNLLAEAEEAYWSAAIAAGNVALKREVLRRRMENKRITDEKYRMKMVPRLDSIRAESLVMAAEALVAQAEAERLNMLALMASLAGGIEAEPAEMPAAAPPPGLGIPAASDIPIDRRPDVKAGRLAVELAAVANKLAAKENAPTMETSLNWVPFSDPSDTSSPQMGEIISEVRLAIPVLDGGAAKNEALGAKKLLESAEASLKHIENLARKETATAINDWNRSVALERAKRSEMEMSNEELRITELMYREGMGAQIDLINAEVENHNVHTEYLDAVKGMYVSMARIRKASGDYAEIAKDARGGDY
jgi:outer membrane protein TolC